MKVTAHIAVGPNGSYIIFLSNLTNIILNLKTVKLFMLKFELRWAEHVALVELPRNAYRISVEKPEGKRPLDSLDIDGG